jgi:hypothetical protein
VDPIRESANGSHTIDSERELMVSTNAKDPNVVMGSALSVPLNLIMGIADLLIQKGLISSNEVAAIAQALSAASNSHGENEAMVKMMLEAFAVRFEAPREKEAGH